jgi:hypothetical protein
MKTAKDARSLSLENVNVLSDDEHDYINDQIDIAISKGLFYIIVHQISAAAQSLLKSNGYSIHATARGYNISW